MRGWSPELDRSRPTRTLIVEKRRGRLHIVDIETGASVYSPPDFIRVFSRAELHQLAERLETGRYIDEVMAYESMAARQLVTSV
jgi:hypothetical protein